MEKHTFFIYGDNQDKKQELCNSVLKKWKLDEWNCFHYDFFETDITDVMNELITAPFFSDFKIIVLNNVDALNEGFQSLKEFIKHPNEFSFLVCIFQTYEEKQMKDILEFVEVKKAEDYKESDFMNTIDLYARKNNCKIDLDAKEELLKRVAGNYKTLLFELDKIFLYYPNGSVITNECIQYIVPMNVEDNVFELQNAILDHNRKRTWKIYTDLMTHNQDPQNIINILSNKFNELMQAKILYESGFSQERIQEYFHYSKGRTYYLMKNIKGISMNSLESIFHKLADLDYQIKSGLIDKKSGLELFLLSLK